MGCIKKAVELRPEEKQELVSFVQDGLGCGCSDEVFPHPGTLPAHYFFHYFLG